MKLSASCYALSGFGFTPPWAVNAGFITGSAVTLIVDAGPSAMAAHTILGYARAVRAANTIRVVNTEQHLDHILGNCVFADEGVDILGHSSIERTAADFDANVAEFEDAIGDAVRREAGEARVFFTGTRVQNPSVLIDAETSLDLGGLSVRLLPAPGHTPSNMLVWVEAEGVLYTGDTVVSGYMPNLDSGGPGDWRLWLRALHTIEGLRPEIVIPGHGLVLRNDEVPRELTRMREVLTRAVATGRYP